MESSDKQIVELYNNLTELTKIMQLLVKRVSRLEIKSIEQQSLLEMSQGLIGISLGFIASKYNKEEYLNYLRSIEQSDKIDKKIKAAASEQLRQEDLWGQLLHEGRKQ